MGYSNSPLATYTRLTSHHSGAKGNPITRITPHCIVGQWTGRQGVDYFATTDRDASANYCIGRDGDIALGVEEKNRAWTTGGDKNVNGRTGSRNDYHAVTIECASDTTHPYAFTSACYNSLINLCADICKRYGKTKLIWIDNAARAEAYSDTMPSNEMLLTVHRWYASKACPGDWLYSRMGDLANKVNAKLGSSSAQPSTPTLVTTFPAVPFLVTVKIPDLNYRSEPKMGDNVKGQTGKGIFTIMEVKNGWGRLKSGVGWVYLENPDYVTVGKHVEQSTPAPAPSTPSTPTAPTTKPEDNMEKIWNGLQKAIGNKYGTAGVMGNIHAESSYRPENLQNTYEKSLGMTDAEYTAKVDSGAYSKDKFIHDSAGYGLAQWTYYSRKQAMYEFIREQKKKSIGDLDAQIEFLVKELKGYTKVWDVLTKAKSIREASDAVLLQFERPADTGEAVQKKRAEYGQQAYDKYAKKETKPADPAPAPVSGGRAKMVAQAQKWLGIKEPNHDEIIKVYNEYLPKAVKRGTRNIKANKDYAWCCIFASACACASGNFDYYPVEMSCGKDIELAQKMGIWQENDAYVPSPGDLILFDWDESSASGDNKAWPDHIGVVEKVENGYVITIEGNYSNMVKRRTNLKVNGRYIRGYIVPKLDNTTPAPAPQPDEPVHWYRVRKSWSDSKSQVGAYKVLSNAKRKADEMGADYGVYDWNGVEVYRKAKAFAPYLVKVSITDLNMRQGPGTNYKSNGFIPVGVYTIVAESDGQGSAKWLKLKSGAGWIASEYAKKL